MFLAVAKSEILWNDLELLNQDQIPQKRAWPFLELTQDKMGVSLQPVWPKMEDADCR